MNVFAVISESDQPNQVILQAQSLAIISTYLLIFSFILITLGAISFVFHLRKTGFIFFAAYGFDIFILPMHITNIIGPFMFVVGLLGLIKTIHEKPRAK